LPKAYDATLKHLVALNPTGWLEFIGIPTERAELLERRLESLGRNGSRNH